MYIYIYIQFILRIKYITFYIMLLLQNYCTEDTILYLLINNIYIYIYILYEVTFLISILRQREVNQRQVPHFTDLRVFKDLETYR